jgi:outer membrane protein
MGQREIKDTTVWTLKKCIAYAQKNNITIKIATLNKNSVEVTYKQSKSALFPNLNANASQSMTHGSSIDPITSDFVSKVVNSSSIGMSTQATIFNGFQQVNQIKQNKLFIQKNEFLIEEAKKDITLNIIQSYIQVLYLKEEVKIAENNIELSQHQLDVITAKYNAGIIDVKTYTDAQSQFATNKYNLVVAKNTYSSQLLDLQQLLELPINSKFEIAPIENLNSTVLSYKKEDVLINALKTLPEIKSGELQIEANTLGVKIAKGGYLPSLSISGNLSTGYTSTQDMVFTKQLNNNFNQSIALQLSIPIWDKNTIKSRVQNAEIEIQKSQFNLISTQKDIIKKMESLWMNQASAQSQTEAANVLRDATYTALTIAQQQFDLGAISFVDLQLSMNNYLNATQKQNIAKHSLLMYQLLIQNYSGNF